MNIYTKNTTIGSLLFLEETDRINNVRAGLFKCHCGKEFKTTITSVKTGNTKSCGCQRIKSIKKSISTHGKTGTVEHECWNSMKRRCAGYNSKNKKNYTDKGIKVCDRWLEPKGQGFLNFLEDMGPRPQDKPTLDRIDGTKNYEPGNCRWASYEEQNNNLSSNLKIEYQGKTQNAIQWAKELGLHKATFLERYHKTGSIEGVINFDPLRQWKTNEWNGKMYSLKELADIKGMSVTGFCDRLKNMTIEEAMEKPLRGNKQLSE